MTIAPHCGSLNPEERVPRSSRRIVVRRLVDAAHELARRSRAVAVLCIALSAAPATIADELMLHAGDATIHGDGAAYQWRAEQNSIGHWNKATTWVSWDIDVAQPDKIAVVAVQACESAAAGTPFVVEITPQPSDNGVGESFRVAGKIADTQKWDNFTHQSVGSVTLTQPGRYRVAFKPTGDDSPKGITNLRGILLHGRSFAAAAPQPARPTEPGDGVFVGERIARFVPRDADDAKLPVTTALIEPLKPAGTVAGDWKSTPTFGTLARNPARWLTPGETTERRTAFIAIEPGTSLYGTGEVAGPLLRNGRINICWNTDAWCYDAGVYSLYQSHPWVLAVRADGSSFGVLADTSWKCEVDLTDGIRFTADGPAFALYVIERPTPQEIVQTLAALTGKTPLPPLWALGYHQCRYSYFPEARVREIAKEFRERRIPCDVIWLDIDYMDGFRVFTFDHEKFPDPKKLNADLHALNFKTVWMIDPGVKVDSGYAVYDSGREGDHFVRTPAGEEFHGVVWPGDCAFPDFTRPETRTWWARLYKDFIAQGVDGVWNDMNEPAIFRVHTMTMPLDNVHRGGGGLPPGSHAQYHNLYGKLMVRATREGIEAARPASRPFVLTRANFVGGQRYAATWTGDNEATWEHLDYSVSMILNLGLSGQPFAGPDIGGFEGAGEPRLFARWMGVGALLPFARGHTAKGTRDKEPWAFDAEVESSCRTALERRYRLLPYIYTRFHEASQNGMPVVRPVFFLDPKDPALRGQD
ncbi:MAG: TIM-barrel domain-containing protein, partial [Phycisphaerae bacterium]